MIDSHKYCARCKASLPISMFSKSSWAKDGFQYKCKPCQKQEQTHQRKTHKMKWASQSPYLGQLKKCCACKSVLPDNQFSVSLSRPDGLQSRCKNCTSKAHRKSKFGIESPKSNSCDICNGTKTLSIDHCHITGKLRGTLCRACNTGIGLLSDSIPRLRGAITYLDRWHTENGLASHENRILS